MKTYISYVISFQTFSQNVRIKKKFGEQIKWKFENKIKPMEKIETNENKVYLRGLEYTDCIFST